jgi:maleylpyruvate isomerase
VPTLVLDDGRLLSQSLAIIEYLEAVQPSPALYPRDPYLAARARQYAELVNAGIQPLQNLGVLQEVKRRGSDEQSWARAAIEKGLGALERSCVSTAGRFLVGDEPTIADVCLVPQLYGARRFQADLSLCPRLVEIEARCQELEAFASAHADRQPDAVKT